MGRTFQVVVDCADPQLLASFWAQALGYGIESPPDGSPDWEVFQQHRGFPTAEQVPFAAIRNPNGAGRVCFMGVAEPKTAKNRLHLDVDATTPGTDPETRQAGVDELAARLVRAGGQVVRVGRERNQYFVTLTDPEGNELCVH